MTEASAVEASQRGRHGHGMGRLMALSISGPDYSSLNEKTMFAIVKCYRWSTGTVLIGIQSTLSKYKGVLIYQGQQVILSFDLGNVLVVPLKLNR